MGKEIDPWQTFWRVLAAVFAAYVLRSVFTYVIWYWGHNFGILVETDIRRDLFRHMQKLSFDHFDDHRVGQLMSRLTAELFDITDIRCHRFCSPAMPSRGSIMFSEGKYFRENNKWIMILLPCLTAEGKTP